MTIVCSTDAFVRYDLVGNVSSDDFHEAKAILEKMKSDFPKRIELNITPMIPMDFLETNIHVRSKNTKNYAYFNKDYILTQESKLLSLLELKKNSNIQDALYRNSLASANSFQMMLRETKHSFVELNITIGHISCGSILIELFDDIVPNTVANFLKFVRGGTIAEDGTELRYKGTKISRVVPRGWIQAGEIMDKSGAPIKGPIITDENYIIPHNRPGIVSMVNAGPHSAFSSFMITFAAIPYFDCKYVAFGRVVDGRQALDSISESKCKFEKPEDLISISSAEIVMSGVSEQ